MAARSKVENITRLPVVVKEIVRQEAREVDAYQRPKTRGECLPGGCNEVRPCPWVGCKYHLYLDVTVASNLKVNFPHGVAGMGDTCSLDVADRGAHSLEEVGSYVNITRERVRQVEEKILKKLRLAGGKELRQFLEEEYSSAAPSQGVGYNGLLDFGVTEGDVGEESE